MGTSASISANNNTMDSSQCPQQNSTTPLQCPHTGAVVETEDTAIDRTHTSPHPVDFMKGITRGPGATPDPNSYTVARKCPFRMPPGHVPKCPLVCQTFPSELTEFTVLNIGCQGLKGQSTASARVIWRELMLQFMKGNSSWFERAHSFSSEDCMGYESELFLLYFDKAEKAKQWKEASGFEAWWEAAERQGETLGLWLETLAIPMSHSETMFTADPILNREQYCVGVGKLGEGWYPTQFCNYSGSARDRIACSGESLLQPTKSELVPNEPDESRGKRIRVRVPEHTCVIRSGQDWALSAGKPREMYETEMAPVLKAGMDYLAYNQCESGTIACRFVQNMDDEGQLLEQTYGLCYSVSLEHLEKWASPSDGHPTHAAIYSKFFELLADEEAQKELGPAGLMTGIGLFHEVFVTPADGCSAEYINCHSKTAFLQWASGKGQIFSAMAC